MEFAILTDNEIKKIVRNVIKSFKFPGSEHSNSLFIEKWTKHRKRRENEKLTKRNLPLRNRENVGSELYCANKSSKDSNPFTFFAVADTFFFCDPVVKTAGKNKLNLTQMLHRYLSNKTANTAYKHVDGLYAVCTRCQRDLFLSS